MRRSLVLSLLLLAACRTAEPGASVELLDYEALVPPSFVARPATSSMRLAEFDVPRTDDTHAEVIVYYFGEGQGGSADANIARWSEAKSRRVRCRRGPACCPDGCRRSRQRR